MTFMDVTTVVANIITIVSGVAALYQMYEKSVNDDESNLLKLRTC